MPTWQLSLTGTEFEPDSAARDAYCRALRSLVATIASAGAAPDALLLAVPGKSAPPAQAPPPARPRPGAAAAQTRPSPPPARPSATAGNAARRAARTACPSCGEPVRARSDGPGSRFCAKHPAPHGLRLAREATHALQDTLREALAFASSTAQTWRACAERWERPSPQLAALAVDFAREAERRAERIRGQLITRAQD